MKLILERTYGSPELTMGHLTVEGTDFECMTSETGFVDYEKAFKGCSYLCLPRGTYKCKVVATKYGPTSIVVRRCPGHVNTLIGFEPLDNAVVNTILVSSPKALKRLNALGRRAVVTGEEIVIEIRNECLTD